MRMWRAVFMERLYCVHEARPGAARAEMAPVKEVLACVDVTAKKLLRSVKDAAARCSSSLIVRELHAFTSLPRTGVYGVRA